MYRYRYTCRPNAERRQTEARAWFDFIAAILVFALIGCMLAWRG